MKNSFPTGRPLPVPDQVQTTGIVTQPAPRQTTPRVVQGGGFTFLTADPFLTAVVRRCAQLEAELRAVRYQEIARFRTLRRSVSRIEKKVCR